VSKCTQIGFPEAKHRVAPNFSNWPTPRAGRDEHRALTACLLNSRLKAIAETHQSQRSAVPNSEENNKVKNIAKI
jgi:hypothetical protein